MRRRPPRSTRTDTLFPYTTLFRSSSRGFNPQQLCKIGDIIFDSIHDFLLLNFYHRTNSVANRKRRTRILADSKINYISSSQPANTSQRSEERRVGRACVRPCRSRWSPCHSKKQ